MKSVTMALLSLSLLACGGTVQDPTQPIFRFTAIPDQNTTELEEKFSPLARYLSEQLGARVEFVPSRDYQASVEMFKNGDVLLAWFGGLTGVQAREWVAGARAIAQGEADPQYFSYFIAHRETGLEPSEDFPAEIGRYRFTFGSESSTSGRLMPEHFIRQQTGKSPQDLFRDPVGFSSSHDKTVELVESGQFQVGAVNYKVYEKRVEQGETDPAVCRVIWKTPFYADYNWTAHPALETTFGRGFINRVQRALIELDDPRLLSAMLRHKLIPARNQDFDGILQVARELKMVRQKGGS